jgi:hypothetical protein
VAAMDIVELHRIELGEATRTLMHRRLRLLPPNRGTRDVCRRLLRGEDAVLGWRRVVWCSLGALRAARGRARLRPVVFDRTAVERAPLRWTYVGVGAVERWAFR